MMSVLLRPSLLAALLVTTLSAPALAAGFDMASGGGGPIEVYADQGIEWSQDNKAFIARGNAKAVRGNVTITADTLTAKYRDKSAASNQPKPQAAAAPEGDMSGGTEIYQLEAAGNVVIYTPTERATGTNAEYNIDTAVMVLVGMPKLVTQTDVVTSNKSLEYWEKEQMAVARGDAVAVRADKTIKADVLSAWFEDQPNKGMTMTKSKGFGNVVIISPRDTVLGDKGDYDAKTGLATLTGNVRMSRGESQLNGGYATVNMNTGMSTLYPTAPGGGSGRVKGLFVPEKKAGEGQPDGASAPAPNSVKTGGRS